MTTFFKFIGCCAGLALQCVLASSCSPLDATRDPSEGREIIQGQAFRHLVLTRNFQTASANRQGPIFVFLENDGLPWQTPTIVSNDPTPRHPVALALFRQTAAPAIYLGRPCHWVGTFEPPCEAYFWTDGRFHPDVLSSLLAALRKITSTVPGSAQRLVLVGHSGGGTLATLIAHALEQPVVVVTMAAVLDHRKWTSRLAVSPLEGSLNPATEPRKSTAALTELHVFGARDEVVKLEDAASYLERFPAATLVLPQADHRCCWQTWWEAEGHRLAEQLAGKLPTTK